MRLTIKQQSAYPFMDIDITGITRKEAESLLESLNKVHQTGHDAQVIEWFKSVLDQGIRAVLAVETSYRSLPLKKFKKNIEEA